MDAPWFKVLGSNEPIPILWSDRIGIFISSYHFSYQGMQETQLLSLDILCIPDLPVTGSGGYHPVVGTLPRGNPRAFIIVDLKNYVNLFSNIHSYYCAKISFHIILSQTHPATYGLTKLAANSPLPASPISDTPIASFLYFTISPIT